MCVCDQATESRGCRGDCGTLTALASTTADTFTPTTATPATATPATATPATAAAATTTTTALMNMVRTGSHTMRVGGCGDNGDSSSGSSSSLCGLRRGRVRGRSGGDRSGGGVSVSFGEGTSHRSSIGQRVDVDVDDAEPL